MAAGLCLASAPVSADVIGLTLLQSVTANLNGAGVRVAQVEADYGAAGDFEVNPGFVSQPAGLFTYFSTSGSASSYPNSVGAESAHADYVGQYFYGLPPQSPPGVATNVVHVDNYDAGDFITVSSLLNHYTATLPASNLNDPVVNQSFIFAAAPTNEQVAVDSAYDNYAMQYRTLFVSGIGNSGGVSPPSTSYDGLGVGAYAGTSSTGPTPDNGRAKPDLVATAQETSLSTPLVAGAAALLIQAGLRGDGGTDTGSATAIATVKALLINGAVKPPDWTNSAPSPLDKNYGAGLLNILNSYEQMAGGKHGYTVSAPVPAGGAHPPTGAGGAVGVLSGWDYDTNSSSATEDGVNHYYFNATNGAPGARFLTVATLVWNRHQNQTAINHLNLYLYNAASGALVAKSVSPVDNVQHLWVPRLPPGRYDLQVWKAGGANLVSAAEPYALAFEFAAVPLAITASASHLTLSWPLYPAGFALESTASLSSPNWNTNYAVPAVVQGQNELMLGAPSSPLFFRLYQP